VPRPRRRPSSSTDRALRTKLTYRDAWSRVLEPAVGELRLGDIRVSTVDHTIREIQQRRGKLVGITRRLC